MRLVLPLAITFVVGMIMILHFFVPHAPISTLGDGLNEWYMIVVSAAIFLGAMNLLYIHFRKIRLKLQNWKYSPVTIIGFLMMFVVGVFTGIEEGTAFNYLYMNAVVPMGATMFSLLAFFVASASFRAFRASNWRATLLLISSFIVMLGRVPIGDLLWRIIPGAAAGAHPQLISEAAEWVMQWPNMAGQRAVMIGAAMGVVAAALRIIFGVERSHLGGAE